MRDQKGRNCGDRESVWSYIGGGRQWPALNKQQSIRGKYIYLCIGGQKDQMPKREKKRRQRRRRELMRTHPIPSRGEKGGERWSNLRERASFDHLEVLDGSSQKRSIDSQERE